MLTVGRIRLDWMRPFRVMSFLPQYFASSLNVLSFPRIAQVFASTGRVIRASSIKRAIFHNFEDFCEQLTELFTILTLFVKSDMQIFHVASDVDVWDHLLKWISCHDVSLEISYIIFYPDQSSSMPLAFPILHLIPLSLAIKFLFTLVKRIRIYVMLNPVVFKD